MTDEPFRTIIEPFRIHSVEPMRLTTRAERTAALAAAGYNLFELRAEEVLIDLLTDSGTGAMSAEQWAGVQRGNEAYAGAPSFYRFREAVTGLFPFSARLADPSGPGCREDLVHRGRRARPGRPEQHPLRHHAGQHRVHRRTGRRPAHPRRASAGPAAPLQGQHGRCGAGAAARRAGRCGPAGDADRDEQFRRRPAGQPGQYPGGPRGL